MRLFLLALIATAFGCAVAAGAPAPPPDGRSADGLWQTSGHPAPPRGAGRRAVVRLDRAALDARLSRAPHESTAGRSAIAPVIVELPLPDGTYARFSIEESPILAPELAARVPHIKTYRGTGLDDRAAHARLDITPQGFHAMITGGGSTVYIDPAAPGNLADHVVSDRPDDPAALAADMEIVNDLTDPGARFYSQFPVTNGELLRVYRLVIAATGEYTVAAGGSQIAALARITTTMNRASEIFERDLAIRFVLSAGPPADPLAVLYTDPATDPYSNDNHGAMIAQNQANLDAVVGPANYDVGHVFGTSAGSGAAVSAACGPLKGSAASGMGTRVGDAFDVYTVAHELGHQFGAHHTYNTTSGVCAGVRTGAHAFEVGSGSTIMALPGLCAPENTVPVPGSAGSNPHFHVESLNEITAFISSELGAVCGVISLSGNTPPTVEEQGATFTIPAQTPFTLAAVGSDPDGDALTYTWEEYDLGTASSGGSAAIDDGFRPLFRSVGPGSTGRRTFPGSIESAGTGNAVSPTWPCESGILCLTGETLPTTSRTMRFLATVRDNRPGAGGIGTAMTTVRVNANVGPLAVTAPTLNTNWPELSVHTVTWKVNGTSTLASNVSILLSMDAGLTFPIVLASSTPNDGSHTIVMPATATLVVARIKVQAVGNIFFDVSDPFHVGTYVAPPGPFTKTYPADGARGVPTPGLLQWSPSTDAWGWEYCLDTVPNGICDTTWTNTGAVVTSVALPRLPAGKTYSWQVRAVNGNGDMEADGGVWGTFAVGEPSTGFADLAVDFGPGIGIWGYYDHGGGTYWRQLHAESATKLLAADINGNGITDLVASFTGAGVWAYVDNAAWQQWSPYDASDFTVGNLDGQGGDDVAIVFANGIWVRFHDGRFEQFSPYHPVTMAIGHVEGAGGPGALVVSFRSAGTWVYRNLTEWVRLTPVVAESIHMADLDGNLQDDVVLQFAGKSGAWVFYDNTGWVNLHSYDATAYVATDLDPDVDSRADLIINFPGAGVWAFTNNSGWSWLHYLNTEAFGVGSFTGTAQRQLVFSFPGAGLWLFTRGTSWTPLHTLSPRAVVVGQLNGI